MSRGKSWRYPWKKKRTPKLFSGEWIDTPKAMDIALKYFNDKSIKNYWFGIGNNEGTIV